MLGDKFKKIEKTFEQSVPNDKYVGIRLDGKSFHTFTRNMDKPFDNRLMKAMDNATLHVIKRVFNNAIFGYTQSDEITIVIPPSSELPFNGRIQKIVSISASAASVILATEFPESKSLPLFDSRIFVMNDLKEVHDNLTWRRLDARKNAINMSVSLLKTEKELIGINNRDRIKLLENTEFERLPEGFMNGRLIIPEFVEKEISFSKHNESIEKQTVIRKIWQAYPATKELAEKVCSIS